MPLRRGLGTGSAEDGTDDANGDANPDRLASNEELALKVSSKLCVRGELLRICQELCAVLARDFKEEDSADVASVGTSLGGLCLGMLSPAALRIDEQISPSFLVSS
jgi:hypothetical protein